MIVDDLFAFLAYGWIAIVATLKAPAGSDGGTASDVGAGAPFFNSKNPSLVKKSLSILA